MLTTTNAVVNQAVASSTNQRYNANARTLEETIKKSRKVELQGSFVRNMLDIPVQICGQSQLPTSREINYLAEFADDISDGSKRMSFSLTGDNRDQVQRHIDSPVGGELLGHELDDQHNILHINVGGQPFTLLNKYVQRYGPDTLIGRLASKRHAQRLRLCHTYLESSQAYFFHRSPSLFQPIYEFFVTGVVHVPENVCFKKFLAEMHFWGVPYEKLSKCCSPVSDDERSEADEALIEQETDGYEHLFANKCAGKLRFRIWKISDGSDGGPVWKVYELMSTAFVLLSISALILGSLPALQVHYTMGRANRSNLSYELCEHKNKEHLVCDEHPVFMWIEYFCVMFFAIDYVARLLVAPQVWNFVKQPLNIIDILVIAPCIMEVTFELYGVQSEQFREFRWTVITVRVLRVLRVMRIAKLGRFSAGLRNFALTMKRSKQHLQMVGVVMITCIVFFSTLVYFLEKDQPNNQFTSIPASFWWCIVTMSTVGYGDAVPQSPGGQLVASATIVCGMMVLAIPITITVNNFMHVSRMNHASLHTLASNNTPNNTPNHVNLMSSANKQVIISGRSPPLRNGASNV